MAKVNIVNVVVLDNPSPFLNPFQFEITFEALEDLSEGSYLPVLCYALLTFHLSDFFVISAKCCAILLALVSAYFAIITALWSSR